jgi:hypothetical protein
MQLISEALRADFDQIANEPLPERWVDLIRDLNARECAQANRHRQNQSPRVASTRRSVGIIRAQ